MTLTSSLGTDYLNLPAAAAGRHAQTHVISVVDPARHAELVAGAWPWGGAAGSIKGAGRRSKRARGGGVRTNRARGGGVRTAEPGPAGTAMPVAVPAATATPPAPPGGAHLHPPGGHHGQARHGPGHRDLPARPPVGQLLVARPGELRGPAVDGRVHRLPVAWSPPRRRCQSPRPGHRGRLGGHPGHRPDRCGQPVVDRRRAAARAEPAGQRAGDEQRGGHDRGCPGC